MSAQPPGVPRSREAAFAVDPAPSVPDQDGCPICDDPSCAGVVIHQLVAVVGAYSIAHRRGDHAKHRPSMCRLCSEEGPGV